MSFYGILKIKNNIPSEIEEILEEDKKSCGLLKWKNWF